MASTAKTENIRVLWIDDEAYRPLAGVSAYLEALYESGMLTDVLASAKSAITHIEANKDPEDIVILDVMMAEDITIDGIWYRAADAGIGILRHRLRNSAYLYSNVPVLILTNRDRSASIFKSVASLPQVNLWMKKDLVPADLPDKVRAMIRRPRARL